MILRLFYSIRRDEREPRFRASEKFYQAFNDEINNLSQGKGDAYEFLKNAFNRHKNAYRDFRPYLKGKKLKQFDEAWREYICYSKENPLPFPEQYFADENLALAREKRELALRRIRNLLSFAKKFTSPSLKHPLTEFRKISYLRRARQNMLHIFVAKHSCLNLRKK
jgi:hypothetical protein